MFAAPILRLEGIRKSYGAIQALRGVDLTVEQGQVVCIIGPSGCGKSTLLRCVNFLEEPEEGMVTVDGESMGFREISGRRRRDTESNINRMRSKIGMVFQQFNIWPHLSGLENVIAPQVYVKGSTRADANVWRSLARWRLNRNSFCSTNQPPPSTLNWWRKY
jgi:polar amino acid transport system ATP-binding protein